MFPASDFIFAYLKISHPLVFFTLLFSSLPVIADAADIIGTVDNLLFGIAAPSRIIIGNAFRDCKEVWMACQDRVSKSLRRLLCSSYKPSGRDRMICKMYHKRLVQRRGRHHQLRFESAAMATKIAELVASKDLP